MSSVRCNQRLMWPFVRLIQSYIWLAKICVVHEEICAATWPAQHPHGLIEKLFLLYFGWFQSLEIKWKIGRWGEKRWGEGRFKEKEISKNCAHSMSHLFVTSGLHNYYIFFFKHFKLCDPHKVITARTMNHTTLWFCARLSSFGAVLFSKIPEKIISEFMETRRVRETKERNESKSRGKD